VPTKRYEFRIDAPIPPRCLPGAHSHWFNRSDRPIVPQVPYDLKANATNKYSYRREALPVEIEYGSNRTLLLCLLQADVLLLDLASRIMITTRERPKHHHEPKQTMRSEVIAPLIIDRDVKPTIGLETSRNKQHRSSSRVAISSTIAWLESLRLPKFLRKHNDGEGGDVPLISGLDRVLFGTQPACETVTVLGVHPPRYLCYMLSGSSCDIIQFGIDLLLHMVFHLEDASLCWALGFGLSVSFRHTTHRYLVFGDYVGGYWASLGRMYAGYSIIIVLSTLFNIAMTRYAHFPHYVAWIVTLLWTGIVNYFILKKLWSFGGKQKTDEPATCVSKDVEEGGEALRPLSITQQNVE
jgi:putative flippase GtrA